MRIGRQTFRLIDVINNFSPADYVPAECESNCFFKEPGWHNCDDRTNYHRWSLVMDDVRFSDRYTLIYNSLKDNGFMVPLAAKAGVLFDGHHRITAAYDLGIEYVDLHICSHRTPIKDLIAIDSNYWYAGVPDSPFV